MLMKIIATKGSYCSSFLRPHQLEGIALQLTVSGCSTTTWCRYTEHRSSSSHAERDCIPWSGSDRCLLTIMTENDCSLNRQKGRCYFNRSSSEQDVKRFLNHEITGSNAHA